MCFPSEYITLYGYICDYVFLFLLIHIEDVEGPESLAAINCIE